MAGRLIRPGLVDIESTDTGSMSAEGKYARPWGEPKTKDDASGNAQPVRIVRPVIRLTATIEVVTVDKLNPATVGFDQVGDLKLWFHFEELERLNMIDSKGRPKIKARDRLLASYDLDGYLLELYETPFYCVEPRRYGPGVGGQRNLAPINFRTEDIGSGT